MTPLTIDDPIGHLPLVGEKYQQKLKQLSIFTIKDLLYHFPFRFDDLSQLSSTSTLKVGEKVTLTGTITSITNIHTRSGKTIQKATFSDENGSIPITWFNQPYLVSTFNRNPNASLSGKITNFRGQMTLTSPQFESLAATSHKPQTISQIHTGRLVPIYHQTAGVSSKWLRSRIQVALKQVKVPDWLPPSIIKSESLIPLNTALKQIHFPQDSSSFNQAKKRLSFNEVFLLQLSAQVRRLSWGKKIASNQFKPYPSKIKKFIASLPFQLTPAQKRCIQEITTDLVQKKPMNRLLQGDVGSGKTVIAAAAAYLCHLNQLPAVFMAPTEILALQHTDTIQKLLSPYNMRISTQTRSKQDDIPHANLIIGTHAILHRRLPDKIGLLIIDEQHRFGVKQRSQLLKEKKPPHLLSMTATPIPRTIALSLYADLDVSVLDQMPPGRTPVKTWVVPQSKRSSAYQWIQKEITQNKSQTFIVCPLVKDSKTPKLDQVKAAESEYQHISEDIFPNLRVDLLHGKMTSQQKSQVTQDFAQHKSDVLVTTPVIEVGIDIKNATIIVIESAERFGLASLHQLRGRVGRSDKKSYCLLFTSISRPNQRIKHLETTNSGMKLAELDLKLRGPGELYGIKQSGYIHLKLASFTDTQLISNTQQHAHRLISTHPSLTPYPHLKEELDISLAKSTSPN